MNLSELINQERQVVCLNLEILFIQKSRIVCLVKNTCIKSEAQRLVRL